MPEEECGMPAPSDAAATAINFVRRCAADLAPRGSLNRGTASELFISDSPIARSVDALSDRAPRDKVQKKNVGIQ
jgi:hypothetical protein